MTILASSNRTNARIIAERLVQSVTENSSPEEQIEFFYFLDKTSLFAPHYEVYI